MSTVTEAGISTVEPHDHAVHFYADEAELAAVVADYLHAALEAGEVAVVLASAAHRAAFEAALLARGADAGRLLALDAEETLLRILVDGEPDRRELERLVGGPIRAAAAAGTPVRVYGEMVAVLWDAGHVNAAIALEDLWNRLARELPFSLLCAYPAASVAGEAHADALGELCRLHSSVVGAPEAATRAFPRALDAPSAARRFAAEQLAPTERAELVADAQLVVSELAANAVVHARSDFGVTLSLVGRRPPDLRARREPGAAVRRRPGADRHLGPRPRDGRDDGARVGLGAPRRRQGRLGRAPPLTR